MTKSLPGELTQRLKIILDNNYQAVLDAFSNERRGSFRINTLKWDGSEVLEEFREKWIIIESFDGLKWVYVFDRIHEYAIKWTRGFYDGKIYLQSIASMLPVLTLAPEWWDTILDVCAAPGSKTTQMSAMMDNTGTITAIEQNQIRYDKLMHNTRLQWATNIEWVKMDARKYLSSGHCEERSNPGTGNAGSPHSTNAAFAMTETVFDRILLDAPCSAEWRISLDNEKSFWFWSIANIRDKSDLQYELLELAFVNLKSWGTLVYSTCTLAPEENEWVISHFLREHTDAKLEDIDIWLSGKPWWTPGISSFDWEKYSSEIWKTVRVLPSDETEGFYLAKIKKSL